MALTTLLSVTYSQKVLWSLRARDFRLLRVQGLQGFCFFFVFVRALRVWGLRVWVKFRGDFCSYGPSGSRV